MSDTNPSTCPRCGAPLSPTDAAGLCPRCLLAMNLRTRTMPTGESSPSHPPPSPAELEQKFPQFEIIECLGRGGMGIVYKARQKALDRTVAIKILPGEFQNDPGFAERFEKEAKLLARLNQPNIVTIHDFGNAGGLYYIVMEYVDGVNVRDLLRDGKMEPEQALAIIPPICEALQFAHNHGVVHRDIKPENILLDREGRVKIADFGIATIAGDAADRSGTPAYMAPEQAAHAAKIDHRADIYALGVVLYEMLTGERPGKDFKEPSKKVRVDVKIDEIVLRALENKPELRFQTAGEFKTLVETMAPAAAPPPPPEAPLSAPFKAPSNHTSPMIPKLALGTLLMAFLGTPLLLSFAKRDEGVVFFGILCLLASIVFTIMSRRTRIGKVLLTLWGIFILVNLGYLALRSVGMSRREEVARQVEESYRRQAEIARIAAREADEEARRAPLSTPPLVEAPSPAPPSAMAGDLTPVIQRSQILVRGEGEYLLDGTPTTMEQLTDQLRQRATGNSAHSVTITASPSSPAKPVTDLLTTLSRLGLHDISVNRTQTEIPKRDRLLEIELSAAFKSYEDLQIRLREAELQRNLAVSRGSETDQKEQERLLELLRLQIDEIRHSILDLQKRSESQPQR
ncbi:serine/threonine-protein kinase [Luteolibacter luteus]|uniref:Protein kinase n=1 Tax=Luteolibacter luteus TaxID=2728835 RepID=A0A858RF77_9BACT|nr:serine/threonine-protein kinase [Luteolibacter luteus]QJE94950.1 protein kinase [Luteolibacter luteus]